MGFLDMFTAFTRAKKLVEWSSGKRDRWQDEEEFVRELALKVVAQHGVSFEDAVKLVRRALDEEKNGG